MSDVKSSRCVFSIGIEGSSGAIEKALLDKNYSLEWDLGEDSFNIFLKEVDHEPTATFYQLSATVSKFPFLVQKHAYVIDFEDLGDGAYFGVSRGKTDLDTSRVHVTVNKNNLYENLISALECIERDAVAHYPTYELNKPVGPLAHD